ncbi:hypothetical protein EJ04DRAFT_301333 [Polyplosphaeria fusca]|uniref:Uncharacterized protein n=1 Tax=Polyplosphaeria fusca TaxID=682080 RepID=A0A9P4QWY6_9PLEO|nr:hypothetical protein EJ04DRAFT_301333 [Polyplosphaeria fusca]
MYIRAARQPSFLHTSHHTYTTLVPYSIHLVQPTHKLTKCAMTFLNVGVMKSWLPCFGGHPVADLVRSYVI